MKRKKITAGVLLCILMMLSITSCKDKTDADLSAFQPPVNYKWEGNYVDENGTATLVIEKKSGKKYACTINVTDEEMTHIDTYEFTAVKDDYGLSYEDGVHTSYDIPDYETDPDASVTSDEVYTNGTGSIYYLEEYVYWLDEKSDAGSEFAFTKTDTEEE